jgi:hypothetical protein
MISDLVRQVLQSSTPKDPLAILETIDAVNLVNFKSTKDHLIVLGDDKAAKINPILHSHAPKVILELYV